MGKLTAQQKKELRERIKTLPDELTEVSRSEWGRVALLPNAPDAVFHSKKYLVQVFVESETTIRLSINRVTVNARGDWNDRLTWDELQAIKRDCGFGEALAVEIYPPDRDVVNVANMRHLWVTTRPLGFGWSKKQGN